MKFTHYLTPDSLDILNLRIKIRQDGCQHCKNQDTVTAHGYLRGYAKTGNKVVTRGLRFFGTDRNFVFLV